MSNHGGRYNSLSHSYKNTFFCTHGDRTGSTKYLSIKDFCAENFCTAQQVRRMLRQNQLVALQNGRSYFVAKNPNWRE
ncbi:MAG: hypothetical protein AAGA60_32695 [Cyanobacteria bacterium P01_E01_bin.42]